MMDLKLTTPDGTVMQPAATTPDTGAFASLQDRMRTEATGDAPADIPAPPKRTADPAAAQTPRRGRPPKTERARTTATAKAPVAQAVADVDYTAGAASLVANVWLGAALIPFTQPYAAVLSANSDSLAAALAEGAKHNETIRGWVQGGGESAWKLQLAGVAMAMGMQCLQLARDPEQREQARAVTKAQLAPMLPKPEAATEETSKEA
jgi:hypothetical protein